MVWIGCGEARSFIYFDFKTNKILLYWRMISNVRCLWWYVDTDVRTQWVKKKISLEIDMLTLVQTKQKERSVDRDKSLKMNVFLLPTPRQTHTHKWRANITLTQVDTSQVGCFVGPFWRTNMFTSPYANILTWNDDRQAIRWLKHKTDDR